MQRLFPALWVVLFLVVSPLHAEPKVYGEQRIHRWWDAVTGNDSNLLIVFYVQIMPDDLVMQLHRF